MRFSCWRTHCSIFRNVVVNVIGPVTMTARRMSYLRRLSTYLSFPSRWIVVCRWSRHVLACLLALPALLELHVSSFTITPNSTPTGLSSSIINIAERSTNYLLTYSNDRSRHIWKLPPNLSASSASITRTLRTIRIATTSRLLAALLEAHSLRSLCVAVLRPA